MKLSEAQGVYRGFSVIKLDTYNLVEIKSVGQGPVPTPLRGLFTNQMVARKNIDFFLDHMEVKSGKTKSLSKG